MILGLTKEISNCSCSKCKCSQCGQKMFQEKRTKRSAPNFYVLYDVWKCNVCNSQWVEQLGEQNLQKKHDE